MTGSSARKMVVLQAGLQSSVQDLGRAGFGSAGVSPSGAVDWFALRAANRLVDNPDGAALVETTMTGFSFRALASARIAVTGADAPLTIRGASRTLWRTHIVREGETVTVGAAREGMRSYVAFDGGVDVAPVLGSRATDVGSRFGGLVLADGDTFVLGLRLQPPNEPRLLAYPDNAVPSYSAATVLRARPGPHANSVGVDAIAALAGRTYRVSSRSTRQAVRLDGKPAFVQGNSDVISCGICAGCVQLPPDGLPLILLAEHQTTGGYAIPACLIIADLPRAAQLRPGDSVSFRLVSYGEASSALTECAARLRALGPHPAEAGDGLAARLSDGFFEGMERA